MELTPSVLITGAAGFFGHHLVQHFAGQGWTVHALVSFRHRGDSARLSAIETPFTVHWHDLRGPISPTLSEQIGHVDLIINAAAESHVDRSIADPVPFVRNNVDVALNILEYARKIKPTVFVQISTDEVYGPSEVGLPEWSPIRPSNPYSASKAAQEALVQAWSRTYNIPVHIVNLMNLIGERQDPEKFLPRILLAAIEGSSVGIHVDPKTGRSGGRQYLDVVFAAEKLEELLEEGGISGIKRTHFVGEYRSNEELVNDVAEILGYPIKTHVEDFHTYRPGHDLNYALAGSVRFRALRETLQRVVSWTLNHKEWLIRGKA